MIVKRDDLTDVETVLARLVIDRMQPEAVPVEQWPMIAAAALKYNLAALLFQRCRDHLSQVEAGTFLHHHVLTAHASFLAQDAARWQINSALRSQDIPTLWIKGSVLAYTVYEFPHQRPMVDLDVVVPSSYLGQASEVLGNLGYKEPPWEQLPLPTAFRRKHEHHMVLQGGPGGQVIVELHWHLLGPHLFSEDQMSWFWSQTVDIEIADHAVTTLRPEAHLLYLCVHALSQHGETIISLRHYYDVHALICVSEINWEWLIQQAVDFEWTFAVERMLSKTVEYFETPVSAAVLTALIERRRPTERSDRVTALASDGHILYKVFDNLRGEPLHVKLRVIFSIVLPPRHYMRDRYQLGAESAVWPWYLRRWWYQLGTVWKTLRKCVGPKRNGI